jgi:hypothetical protein
LSLWTKSGGDRWSPDSSAGGERERRAGEGLDELAGVVLCDEEYVVGGGRLLLDDLAAAGDSGVAVVEGVDEVAGAA